MSQIFSIRRVKHAGAAVYLGEVEGVDTWSRNPERIVEWMCDGYRDRFNQHRSNRSKYAWQDGEVLTDDSGERLLVPIGSMDPIKIKDKQARVDFSHLAALPMQILQHPEKVESTEWWAANKRRKTNVKHGRPGGRMPSFRSKKRGDLRFGVWFNGGKNAVLTRTGRRSGVLTIVGQNSGRHRDHKTGKCKWSIKITVRLSDDVRDYTSVQVDWKKRQVVFINEPAVRQLPQTGSEGGFDRGSVHAIASSDGQFFDMPSHAADEKRRKFHQKRMAKSRVIAEREDRNFWDSSRYQEHKRLAAKASNSITDRRKDFLHKATTKLVQDYDLLVFEGLNVRGMTRAARGRGRRSKTGMNRGILNSGWSTALKMVEYKIKGNDHKSLVDDIDPAYTSQRCPECGHIAAENRESQAVFCCVACDHAAHADTVGAINTLERHLTGWTSPAQSKGQTGGSQKGTVSTCDEAQTPALFR